MNKYDELSERYRFHDYADPGLYFERRAHVALQIGPRLERDDVVLDLPCGDGALAGPLIRRGFRYLGVDASSAMVQAARRLEPGARFEVGTLDEYEPPEPVDAVFCFRAFYYASDRRAFFARMRTIARKKLVLDVDPRRFPLAEIRADLLDAGFAEVTIRRFATPQRRRLPRPAQRLMWLIEPTPFIKIADAAGFPQLYLVSARV